MKESTRVYILNRIDIGLVGKSCFVTFTDSKGKTRICEANLFDHSSTADRAVIFMIARRMAEKYLQQEENESKHTETR